MATVRYFAYERTFALYIYIYTLCVRLCDNVGAIKMHWIRNIMSLVILQITLFITKRQSNFNLMIFKMLPASAWCHTTCWNALPGSNWTCFAPFISATRTNIIWIVSAKTLVEIVIAKAQYHRYRVQKQIICFRRVLHLINNHINIIPKNYRGQPMIAHTFHVSLTWKSDKLPERNWRKR